MKQVIRAVMTAGVLLAVGCKTSVGPQEAQQATGPWQLGVQAYTFRKFTFFETVEKCEALGLSWVEMYPGQTIGGGLEGKTHHSMDAATRAAVWGKLEHHNVRVAAYGVVGAGTPAGWREVFEFARDMAIPTVVSEPAEKDLDTVEALSREFEINVAIHNHADPSRYWKPETVAAACQGRYWRLGACADNGHWLRSGLDPVACLKALEGRIVSLHLKDMSAAEKSAHCVPFGEGVGNVPAFLAELKRQGFAGFIAIEYEHQPDDCFLPVKRCVRYFRAAAEMSADELLSEGVPDTDMTADVAQVWQGLDPGDDGRWTEAGDAETSAYRDLTDGVEGTVTASGLGFDKEHYPNAFDNDPQTKWCIETPTIWIQYAFPEGSQPEVVAYTIRTANDVPDRDPKNWRLLGSGDGTNWTVLDERSNERWTRRFQSRLFKVKNPGAYRYYKLDVTSNSGNPTTTQLSEIELLAPAKDGY